MFYRYIFLFNNFLKDSKEFFIVLKISKREFLISFSILIHFILFYIFLVLISFIIKLLYE